MASTSWRSPRSSRGSASPRGDSRRGPGGIRTTRPRSAGSVADRRSICWCRRAERGRDAGFLGSSARHPGGFRGFARKDGRAARPSLRRSRPEGRVRMLRLREACGTVPRAPDGPRPLAWPGSLPRRAFGDRRSRAWPRAFPPSFPPAPHRCPSAVLRGVLRRDQQRRARLPFRTRIRGREPRAGGPSSDETKGTLGGAMVYDESHGCRSSDVRVPARICSARPA